jgi:hypothetical protein
MSNMGAPPAHAIAIFEGCLSTVFVRDLLSQRRQLLETDFAANKLREPGFHSSRR